MQFWDVAGFVLVSLCYVSLRWLFEFVARRVRSREFKELEIMVLPHELAILRRSGDHRRWPGGARRRHVKLLEFRVPSMETAAISMNSWVRDSGPTTAESSDGRGS